MISRPIFWGMLALFSGLAAAQDYPNRPIRLILANAPGGAVYIEPTDRNSGGFFTVPKVGGAEPPSVPKHTEAYRSISPSFKKIEKTLKNIEKHENSCELSIFHAF